MNDIILRRMYTPWLRYDWLFKYTSTGRLEKKLVRFINDHNEELIKKRKIEFEEKENNNNENLQKSKLKLALNFYSHKNDCTTSHRIQRCSGRKTNPLAI